MRVIWRRTCWAVMAPEQIAGAFIKMWREGRSAPEVLSDSLPIPERSPPRERGDFGPSVWFQLSVGRSGRAEARWLLPKICEAGNITKDGIGAIRVQEDRTFVQILTAAAGKFGQGVELESRRHDDPAGRRAGYGPPGAGPGPGQARAQGPCPASGA